MKMWNKFFDRSNYFSFEDKYIYELEIVFLVFYDENKNQFKLSVNTFKLEFLS